MYYRQQVSLSHVNLHLMKPNVLFLIVLSLSCGKNRDSERCRNYEEAQLRCQLDYIEKYEPYIIPEWVKEDCQRKYPESGCYYLRSL